MSLRAQIVQFQRESVGGMPSELRNTLMADTMQLVQSGLAAQSIKSGELAPSFALPNAVGKRVVLAELLLRSLMCSPPLSPSRNQTNFASVYY